MQERKTRRSRRVLAPLACLIALGALFAPGAASAQFMPYQIVHLSEPYQPLPLPDGGPVQNLTFFNGSTTLGHYDPLLPANFTVRFFDQVYGAGEMSVGTEGYVTFGPIGTANITSNEHYARNGTPQLMDNPSVPNQLIALWWDNNSCESNRVKVQTLGLEPARIHVIETHCRHTTPTTGAIRDYEVQLWLFEGSSTMKVHYGKLPNGWNPSSPASTGMTSPKDPSSGAVVGYDFLDCGNA